MKWHAVMFEEIVKQLGIHGINHNNAVGELRAFDAEKVVSMLPIMNHWSPCLDGQFLKDNTSARSGISDTWCKHILMGDMAHDVSQLKIQYQQTDNDTDPSSRDPS